MITSTFALASTSEPEFGAYLFAGIVLLVIAIVLGSRYSRLFDSGREDTLGMEIVTGVCVGVGLVFLLCAFW